MIRHTVPEGVGPTPLAQYLKRAYPALPGWALRNLMKKRDVRIGGARSGPDAMVRSGDELVVYIDEKFLSDDISVLYDDGQLLAVIKPVGLPVDADDRNIGADTLLSRLRAHWPGAQLCHRLDVGTGGVLLAALTEEAHGRALQAFRDHSVRKLYNCVVRGVPHPERARLHAYLIKQADLSTVCVVDAPRPGALPIETGYATIRSARGLSLMEVELITGRTHQIRAHMAHIGYPIVGDDKYGDRALNRRERVAHPLLWCAHIEIWGHVFESEPPFGGMV